MVNVDRFTIFEHESLLEGNRYYGCEFTAKHHVLLQGAWKEKDFPYYSLIRNGVRFCEFVGVIQIGRVRVEVLPKADKTSDQDRWRAVLLNMLQVVYSFRIHAPSHSNVKLKQNSVLDLYFILFVEKTEKLLHQGLIKKYLQVEQNSSALKGSICFNQHIQHNLVHQERFFVRHSIYSAQNALNAVIYKTIRLLARLNTNAALSVRIDRLLLNFPEMPDIQVDDKWFDNLQYNRKMMSYRPAVEIARLLLLRYHPALAAGKSDVLALMFDMNLLWEKFVYKSLAKHINEIRPTWSITAQAATGFWRAKAGRPVKMKPDIVLKNRNGTDQVVLDTKWKIPDKGPSVGDLRQMYAYSRFHGNAATALIYPGDTMSYRSGHFLEPVPDAATLHRNQCGIVVIGILADVSIWQRALCNTIYGSVGLPMTIGQSGHPQ